MQVKFVKRDPFGSTMIYLSNDAGYMILFQFENE